MNIEISTSDSSRSPGQVLRRSIIIGAVLGAVLFGVAAMMLVGAVMVGGAAVGAAFGAVFGIFKALLAVVRRE